jgi:hypothetical protein
MKEISGYSYLRCDIQCADCKASDDLNGPPSPAIDIPLSAKTKEEIIKRGPWYLVQIGEGMEQVGREAMLRENVLDAMEEYAQRQRAPAIEGKEEDKKAVGDSAQVFRWTKASEKQENYDDEWEGPFIIHVLTPGDYVTAGYFHLDKWYWAESKKVISADFTVAHYSEMPDSPESLEAPPTPAASDRVEGLAWGETVDQLELFKKAVAEIRLAYLPPDTHVTLALLYLEPSTMRIAQYFFDKLSAAKAKIAELEQTIREQKEWINSHL